MQTWDECPVTTAYQLPLYPYKVHNIHLFLSDKIDMSHWKGKHFCVTSNIQRKQQTDISDKKWKKPSVNFILTRHRCFRELFKTRQIQTSCEHCSVFLRKSILLAQMLRVTIAVSHDINRGRPLQSTGWSREWAGGCKVMSGPGHLELLLSLTSYRDHPGHKQMFCIVFMFRYWYPARLQSWMKPQITMKSLSLPPSSTLTNCCTKMASTRRRK